MSDDKKQTGPFDGCRDDWQMPGPTGPRTKKVAKQMRKPPFLGRKPRQFAGINNPALLTPETQT